MSLADAHMFLRVVEVGSLAGAARKMGLTQTTIGRSLDRLEKSLGLKLTDPTSCGVELTEAGAFFAERARELVSSAARLERDVAMFAERSERTVRISACAAWSRHHLGPVLADFVARYRDIRIELTLEERGLDLGADGFDIAIRTGTPPPGPDRRVLKLPDYGFVVVASPAYLARHAAPEVPIDLVDHRLCVVVTDTRGVYWPFRRRGHEYAVHVVPSVEVNDVDVAARLARVGVAVTVLPDYVAARSLRAGELVSLLPEWSLPAMPVQALHPPTKRMSGPARAFLEHLRSSDGT